MAKSIIDTCPICQETRIMQCFKCTHALCYECRKEIRDFHCAICRKDLRSELSKEEVKRIIQLKRKDKDDREYERKSKKRKITSLFPKILP
jgi:hypothetical protein